MGKAEGMEQLLGEEEGLGRIRRRLDELGHLIGVVVGRFNELSDDGHFLMDAMASAISWNP